MKILAFTGRLCFLKEPIRKENMLVIDQTIIHAHLNILEKQFVSAQVMLLDIWLNSILDSCWYSVLDSYSV
jgi:hypothetical protein